MLPGAQITAIDAFPPFLDALKRLAAERGVADRIDVQQGNLFELDFGEPLST